MKTKITNIGSIVIWDEIEHRLVEKNKMDILIDNGIISEIRPVCSDADEEIDADGALITPGFVDPHTHPIFIGNRAHEFSQRTQGKSYAEISRTGGGILSSIRGVRDASEDELFDELQNENYDDLVMEIKVLIVEELEDYLEKEINVLAKETSPKLKIYGKEIFLKGILLCQYY